MIAIAKQTSRAARTEQDEAFLSLLPAIKRHAGFAFRAMDSEQREDAVSEVVANAFQAFRRLLESGKSDLAYAEPLARFGVARFRAGRRVGTQWNTRDVYARQAQAGAGFCLERLDAKSSNASEWNELLTDDTLTPIPDQVAFRLDFLAWLANLHKRQRRLALFLAVGNGTKDAARRFGLSCARVSQIRGELRGDWAKHQQEKRRRY